MATDPANATAADGKMEINGDLPIHSRKGKEKETEAEKNVVRLNDLPTETLRAIIKKCPSNDQRSLQRVSRQLHHLASAQLYRHLDFNIISTEADDSGDRRTRSAEALQTINVSDYDYAQHIKRFRLGAGQAADLPASRDPYNNDPSIFARVIFDSKSDASKLLNISILQLVKKTTMLETFIWDLPMELSGAVYKALQTLSSLRNLQLRLDVYEPPVLQLRLPPYSPPASMPPPPVMPPTQGFSSFSPINPPPPPHLPTTSNLLPTKHDRIYPKKPARSAFWNDQRALAGFSHLHILKLYRLYTLDCLPQIKECIRCCSPTLKHLTISLDLLLVNKPRRSQNLNYGDDQSDSYLEDSDTIYDPEPAQNDQDMRESKAAQERILATIFGLEASAQEGKRLEDKLRLTGGKYVADEMKSTTKSRLKELMNAWQETKDSVEDLDNLDDSGLSQLTESLRKVRDATSRFIGTQATQGKSSPRARERPAPKKKPYKAKSKPPPKYPPPPPPGFNDNADNLDYLHPYSTNSTAVPNLMGGSSGNPWAFNDSKVYLDAEHPTSQLPEPSGSNSYGLPPPLPWPNSSTTDLNNIVLPHSSASGPPGPKPLPTGAGLPPVPFYNQSSFPTTSTVLSNKQISKLKHGSNSFMPHSSGTNSNFDFDNLLGDDVPPPPGLFKSHSKKKGHDVKWKAKPTIQSSSGKNSAKSENESDDNSKDSSPKTPFFEASGSHGDNYGIDFDMDHPDEDQFDSGDDQESTSDGGKTIHAPLLKPAPRPETGESSKAAASVNGVAPKPTADEVVDDEASHIAQMHEYVRTTHGLQLEEFRMHLVPMKASVLARALDLSTLQRITLLDTGPQDAFWALLMRLGATSAPITLKYIHTDNTSLSLFKYLTAFSGLEELYLHEKKQRTSSNSEASASRTDMDSLTRQFRKPIIYAQRHSLRVLLMRNERNPAWDLDVQDLHHLAMWNTALEELSVSMTPAVYHIMLQLFAFFKNLRALHVSQLRSAPGTTQMEAISYTSDALLQLPECKVRYVAIGNLVMKIPRGDEYRKCIAQYLGLRDKHRDGDTINAKGKGKGKAVDASPAGHDGALDEGLADRFAQESLRQRRPKPWPKLDAIPGVGIFANAVRTGRL